MELEKRKVYFRIRQWVMDLAISLKVVRNR